tara:strand:+ start:3705 stop:3980 length:276 start_codon:yes stop_codon:yes gene_type:complete
MLNYLVEFIGTFVFLSVILRTGEALPIAVALAAVIYFGGAVSGGHFNPAVSTMMLLKNNLSAGDYIPYVVLQVLGGVCALYFYQMTKAKSK